MIVFPNGKINLGLYITRRRDDGYHDLQTVFYPVGLRDAFECIKTSDENNASVVSFSSSGLPIAGEENNNLCVKAWHLLKNDFPEISSVKMHLLKQIPMGAGIGGGSADGAFTLQLLNRLLQLNISDEQLEKYALQLGSDCPFFIRNKPCLATGRGEHMQSIDIDLSMYRLMIVFPGVHVSTAEAFAGIVPREPETPLENVIRLPVTEWKNRLHNQFEDTVFVRYPEIASVKQTMYDHGALYASMTGSGSAVYGVFEKEPPLQMNFPSNYAIWRER